MRNLRKYIIASVTLVASALSFGSVAFAQAVKYDKKLSGPNEKGVFTLNLEAYATGSVTVTTKPSDIILVLDRSGSMNYNMAGQNYGNIQSQDRRINILKNAVQGFVQNLKDNPVTEGYTDDYGGHRIAIVWFSGQSVNDDNAVYTGITGLNEFQAVENLDTYEASGSGNSYQAARVTYNGNNLLGVSPDGGTFTNKAMQKAEAILADQDYSDKPDRSVLVVFFTDGEPGSYGWSGGYGVNDGTTTANGCIQAAYNIKNSTDYKATIYSVGLLNVTDNTRNQSTTYLSYVSSDFKDKTQMPSSSNDYVGVSKDKSIIVTSAAELYNIFSSISESAASAASGSSVLVDIVASNFSIPTNADLGSVKVYQVPCTQASATSMISFSDKNATGALAWMDITSTIGLDTSNQANGEVSVTGFDYAENWCGWDGSANNNQGAAHGSKLVLEIPITVKDDVVGGPSVDTNAPGSKIVVKNKNGDIIEENEFISPVVKIPVTIWIKKTGLLSSTADTDVQGHEDNAVFTIRKIKFAGRYETDANGNELEGGKHIDYYFKKGEWDDKTGPKFKIMGKDSTLLWTTFTKVSINLKTNTDGIAKISGLDPDYIYRIEEDAWAHLGYDFDPDATAQYTLKWNATTGRYDELSNPFEFDNTPKTTAFYAEDIVRNVFNPGSAAPTTPPTEETEEP